MWQFCKPVTGLESDNAREGEYTTSGSDGTYKEDSSSVYRTVQANINLTSTVRKTTSHPELPFQFTDQVWQPHLPTGHNIWLSSSSDMLDAPVNSGLGEMYLEVRSQKYI